MIITEELSIEDYIALEEKTGERYEFIHGEVKAMAGTTLEHELIVNNLIRLLSICLREKGCALVSGQMKLFTPHCNKAFLHPDIHIYCGDIQQEKMPKGAYALVNPSIIIEVLSKDTRNYDHGDKFDCYRKIESLQAYFKIESQLDSHKPEIYQCNWDGEKEFQEKTLNLEETPDILGYLLTVKEVFDFPKQKKRS